MKSPRDTDATPRRLATVVPFVGPQASPEHRERELLATWRDSHWNLQERLSELARATGHDDLEALYQAARQADTRLTELYQRRAEALARQVRDLLLDRPAALPGIAATVPLSPISVASNSDAEAALLAWFREMTPEDRAALTSLAERLSRRGAPDR